MQEWNERIFLWINGDWGSPLLDPLFLALSWLGEWAVAVPVAVVLWRSERRRFLTRQLPVLLLGVLLVVVATQQAKDVFDADRPIRHFRHDAEVTLRLPSGDAPSRRSFPSGHSALSFFLLTHLSLARPRHASWALPLATGIAVSRVYVAAHFPFDCVAGAALGGVFACGTHFAVRRLT